MPPSADDDRRLNGLQYPWHPLQVVTWVLFPALLAQYFLFLMPLMWSNIILVCILSLIFGISSIIAAVAGYATCAIDPADNALVGGTATTDPTVYCYLCETDV